MNGVHAVILALASVAALAEPAPMKLTRECDRFVAENGRKILASLDKDIPALERVALSGIDVSTSLKQARLTYDALEKYYAQTSLSASEVMTLATYCDVFVFARL